MADTGVVYCRTGTSVSSAPYDDQAWVGPDRITADDTTYSSITNPNFDLGTYSYLLCGTNFDFSAIPDGSTIDGIAVSTGAAYVNGTGSYTLVQLLNASSVLVGDNKASPAVALSTPTITNNNWGSSTDTWNASPTAAMVKNSNFGVALGFEPTANDCDVYVDYVRMTVYYTAPSGNSNSICMVFES